MNDNKPLQQRRKERARAFWNQYEIPIEYATAIKVRISGLQRGSSGDGRARDTVVHFHVLEAFTEGRLSRDEDTYLCTNKRVDIDGSEQPLAGDLHQPVTCTTCVDRMSRWLIDQ